MIILEIFGRNVNELDLDLSNGPRSNLNLIIDSTYASSYSTVIAMLANSVTILEIFAVEMCIAFTLTLTLTLTLRTDKGQI